jgi:hypothetical protein
MHEKIILQKSQIDHLLKEKQHKKSREKENAKQSN